MVTFGTQNHPHSKPRMLKAEGAQASVDLARHLQHLPPQRAAATIKSPPAQKYEKLAKVGQGTFGEVFKIRSRATGKVLAMKTIRTAKEHARSGLPLNVVREIKILRQARHRNIVGMFEAFHDAHRQQLCLVLEFCEHDLAGLLANGALSFKLSEVKSLARQLLNALCYLHLNCIVHRDLKPANVLLTRGGVVKLADFGLARQIGSRYASKPSALTTRVVTLWYRAPELLLGDKAYGAAIDMWSVGCILAEMWTRVAIMRGDSEAKQLEIIESWCGSLCLDVWPDLERLELFAKICLGGDGARGVQKRRVRENLRAVVRDANAVELIDRMLALDPKRRIDADSALNHDFFWTDPMPGDDLSEKFACIHESNYEFTSEGRRKVGLMLKAKENADWNDSGYVERVY